jgi:hypothetical protein
LNAALLPQAAIGGCYELLRDREGVPKETVNPLVEEAYKATLNNYPGCYATNGVAYRLAGLMLEEGDKAGAIKYYQKFLETANSTSSTSSGQVRTKDDRIATVRAKLAELTAEGGTN